MACDLEKMQRAEEQRVHTIMKDAYYKDQKIYDKMMEKIHKLYLEKEKGS